MKTVRLNNRSSHRGFSLFEILIALALLTITATFVGTKVLEQFEEGKVNTAKINMKNLASVLDEYRRKCRVYPSELGEVISPPAECKNAPPEGFLDAEELPLDPWESDYEYTVEANGRKYVLKSLGADILPGGEGFDADICSYTGRVKECREE